MRPRLWTVQYCHRRVSCSSPRSTAATTSCSTRRCCPAAQRWELSDLVKLRLSVEQYGLKLMALENVPTLVLRPHHAQRSAPRRADREHDLHRAQHRPRRHSDLRLQLDAVARVAHSAAGRIRGGAVATAFDDAHGPDDAADARPRVFGGGDLGQPRALDPTSSLRLPRRRASAWASTRAIHRCRCWAASRRS